MTLKDFPKIRRGQCPVQFMSGQGSCCCPVDLGRKVGPSAIPQSIKCLLEPL